ncbi:amino acid transporter heavy chain SLC3A2 [Odontesthes bonariensis]|uniref:amino acid transporter heavy chain SLC3A2 n=1 Tax=Odontesthes bonariensis TaxID=219752 RepID=UPI003F58A6BE
MPLNAGESGYGGVPEGGLAAGVGNSETAPLLIPEPDPEPVYQWQPLSKGEVETAAGGPGWRRARCYLVVLFWIAWVSMLAISVAIVVMSPRPVGTSLKWWQSTVYYRLQPDLSTEAQAEGSQGVNGVCERLPYLRSLGIGALILEGVFTKRISSSNLTEAAENMEKLSQIQHLLIESSKADLRVVLDFCNVDPLTLQDVADNLDKLSNRSAAAQHALRFWLEQGVAGFVICDTDAAYSEKTLLEWRGVLEEFSSQEERIVVVKQTRDVLHPLNGSGQNNVTLVNVVMRSILPYSDHLLSAQEVADAIETQLQTWEEDVWSSWTVGGEAPQDLKKLLLMLMMTLPGSPALEYNAETGQTQSESQGGGLSHRETDEPSDANRKTKKRATALFTTLSHSKAREEALLYGSFTFLSFNTSSNFSSSSNSTSPPILAFLRSWGCVEFLVLLNIGPEPHSLDPAWAPSLPETGVFVASTGMNHLGSTSLYTLKLQPNEAIAIKLFKAGSYS